MKNYYEILEVNETASQEVIERVYKLLAKKYHPDMNPDNPKEAEDKFKEISEAYEVLSNDFKRKEYDNKLKAQRMIDEKQSQNVVYKTQTKVVYQPQPNVDINRMSNEEVEQMKKQFEEMQKAELQRQKMEQEYQIKKAYNDAYIAALESMGVRVVYKKTWRERWESFKALVITFLVIALTLFIVWHIPYTHDKLMEMYDDSGYIKYFIEKLLSK